MRLLRRYIFYLLTSSLPLYLYSRVSIVAPTAVAIKSYQTYLNPLTMLLVHLSTIESAAERSLNNYYDVQLSSLSCISIWFDLICSDWWSTIYLKCIQEREREKHAKCCSGIWTAKSIINSTVEGSTSEYKACNWQTLDTKPLQCFQLIG